MGAQLVASPKYPVICRGACWSTEELLKLKSSCGTRANEQNWPTLKLKLPPLEQRVTAAEPPCRIAVRGHVLPMSPEPSRGAGCRYRTLLLFPKPCAERWCPGGQRSRGQSCAGTLAEGTNLSSSPAEGHNRPKPSAVAVTFLVADEITSPDYRAESGTRMSLPSIQLALVDISADTLIGFFIIGCLLPNEDTFFN